MPPHAWVVRLCVQYVRRGRVGGGGARWAVGEVVEGRERVVQRPFERWGVVLGAFVGGKINRG